MTDTVHEEVLIPGTGGQQLIVSRRQNGGDMSVALRLNTNSDCVLHWGLYRRAGQGWHSPPREFWPAGTAAFDARAVRSPFALNASGEREVHISLGATDSSWPWRGLAFVLYFPKENRWLKHGQGDFCVELPRSRTSALSVEQALTKWAADSTSQKIVQLDGGEQLGMAWKETAGTLRLSLVCDADGPLLLHWGIAWRVASEWTLPPENFRPEGTIVFDARAVRTSFSERDGLRWLELSFKKPANALAPSAINFVLFQPGDNFWMKSAGKEIHAPLFESESGPGFSDAKLREIADRIVAAETGNGSWTLMHRFNLCHDMLQGVEDNVEALSLLFAWLRYSAIRQLDWQRRFNTQPRDLSHAQNRLTTRLAGIWKQHANGRVWARLMLTTLGRGGDGQRVRDEILQIMHRHHVKEVGGSFMEEWHQKLHNNTTPDDVLICEAYLAFMANNGDTGLFYRVLEGGGVTRERLRGFERPIKADPTFFADRKGGLIHDFTSFLGTLKSVHSGTDFGTAANAARGRMDGGLNQNIDDLFAMRHRNAAADDMADAITSSREALAGHMVKIDDHEALRDLLFLDLSLEEMLRASIERQSISQFNRDGLVALVHLALRNICVSTGSPEFALCVRHWAALMKIPRDGHDWAVHAKSVADRIGRAVQAFTGEQYNLLQPKAEALGAGFQVAEWVVPLFSEEVIRGGPAFVLSAALRRLDPILRSAAGMGGWQVISPAQATGKVRPVDKLVAIQSEHFDRATVLIADTVDGSEEIPEGVTAVITSDNPDLVSHVAVRARNAHVLFATCFDAGVYKQLKELKDHTLCLQVNANGDVQYEEVGESPVPGASLKQDRMPIRHAPIMTKHFKWALAASEFTREYVGGKSNNLNGLRGRLGDWIHFPESMALPFGVFEKVLEHAQNSAVFQKYLALLAALAAGTRMEKHNPAEALAKVRATVLELLPPPELKSALLETWARAGLPSGASGASRASGASGAAQDWEKTWHAITRVWASKWNERAYLSRRARHVPDEDLLMAVLIQRVIEAEYAFVIHTVNPITGNRDEIYAEVVLGMGETLVGNYPGRAMSFVCRKSDLHVELLSYPGKNMGVYGRGLIFRSDSNGEDLEGFAGAGLYDSVLAHEPEWRILDYSAEALVWKGDVRQGMLQAIARIGLEVEKACGSAQDIEGALCGGKYYVVQTRPQVGL